MDLESFRRRSWRKHEPKYTDEARAAKLEGKVALTIVVGTDQRAHDIKVTKSLDPGLDASAIASYPDLAFPTRHKERKARAGSSNDRSELPLTIAARW